ncbi:MAG TPA: hypothetical protein VE891_02565 [Allosphingosinicella sp.]|nr:hypothetical protein [Allosphingosinicella sp.]
MQRQDRANANFYLRLAAIGVLTYLIHEAAHWVTGQALGYPVQFGINGVTSTVPMTASDHISFSLAGPCVTILGAVAAYFWIRREHSLTAYAVLYFSFFMRLVATVVSLFNPNDEARASQLLGLGVWTIPALVVLGLGALTFAASRKMLLSWKVNLGAYFVSSVVIAAIVGLDMALRP